MDKSELEPPAWKPKYSDVASAPVPKDVHPPPPVPRKTLSLRPSRLGKPVKPAEPASSSIGKPLEPATPPTEPKKANTSSEGSTKLSSSHLESPRESMNPKAPPFEPTKTESSQIDLLSRPATRHNTNFVFPGNMDETGLTVPKKTSRVVVSHDGDPAADAEDVVLYNKEKAGLARKGLGAVSNVLLDTININQDKKAVGMSVREAAAWGRMAPNTEEDFDSIHTATNRDYTGSQASKLAIFNASDFTGQGFADGQMSSINQMASINQMSSINQMTYGTNQMTPFEYNSANYPGSPVHSSGIQSPMPQFTSHATRTPYEDMQSNIGRHTAAPGGMRGEYMGQNTGDFGVIHGAKYSHGHNNDERYGYGGNNQDQAEILRSWYGFGPEEHSGIEGQYPVAGPANPSSTPSGTGRLHLDENAGWTSSKTWKSPQEQEYQRWEKIQANLHRSGMGNSPFVPRSLKEYIDLKTQTTMAKQQTVLKKIQDRQEEAEQSCRAGTLGQAPVRPQASKYLRGFPRDGLTLATARPSVWAGSFADAGKVSWPTPMEFKMNGDERAKKGQNRRLPPPRLEVLDEQHFYLLAGQNPVPIVGPGVPPQLRKVAEFAQNPVFDSMTKGESSRLNKPTEEIQIEELPLITRGLIEEIDNDDSEI
ncbi:hypothetical protein AAE478_005876 [Parahypoxylon ruwenzoriense]